MQILPDEVIVSKIYVIRGKKVMVDRDLAELYDVETRILNQAVRRNEKRFPEDFMFQMNKEEMEDWKSQIVISNSEKMGLRKPPLVFTEQGVAMLSAVLRSETAIKVSIQIMQAFVEMKKFLSNNAVIFQRLEKIELKQIETNKKFEQIFNALQSKDLEPKQGIFFNGQIFDAYKFVSGLVRKANKSILLIVNYIDETVLNLFTKKKKNVKVTIFTKRITKTMLQDSEKFNAQYPFVELKKFTKAHDRFLIIDDKDVYHFGASLKDLGKKWFAFSKLDKSAFALLQNLEKVI